MGTKMREFETGATRDTDEGKADYEGFISPLVIEEFGLYMLRHQTQANGAKRSSDNWQKGMPRDAYIKSAWRHFLDWWLWHRGWQGRESLREALCGVLFNVMGYLNTVLQEERTAKEEDELYGYTAPLLHGDARWDEEEDWPELLEDAPDKWSCT